MARESGNPGTPIGNDCRPEKDMSEKQMNDASPSVSSDALFDALADQRRRYVLSCLRKGRNPMAVADLAGEVAARENGSSIDEIPPEMIEQAYASLCHSHIPKLADANLVAYDRDRGTVSLAENSERIEAYLDIEEG